MKENEIFVRRYIDSDYTNIIKGGYPSYWYLRPNFRNRLKNLINWVDLPEEF